jgi:hypothetical protein
MSKIHIIGGGTFSHVRSHLALAAPAFGETAKKLYEIFCQAGRHPSWIGLEKSDYGFGDMRAGREQVLLHLTKMARADSRLVTNDDVAALLEELKADPETRVIILSAALCDFDGSVVGSTPIKLHGFDSERWGDTPSGSHEPRLKTTAGTADDADSSTKIDRLHSQRA